MRNKEPRDIVHTDKLNKGSVKSVNATSVLNSQLSDSSLQKRKNKFVIATGESQRSSDAADSDRSEGDFVAEVKKIRKSYMHLRIVSPNVTREKTEKLSSIRRSGDPSELETLQLTSKSPEVPFW